MKEKMIRKTNFVSEEQKQKNIDNAVEKMRFELKHKIKTITANEIDKIIKQTLEDMQ